MKPTMNESLFIPKSALKPGVIFLTTGECRLYGESRPEELDGFYYQIKHYLKEMVKENIKINFTFDFDYFNTLAQRYLYDLLQILNEQKEPGQVVWLYDPKDESMEELGDTFKVVFPKLKIKIKSR